MTRDSAAQAAPNIHGARTMLEAKTNLLAVCAETGGRLSAWAASGQGWQFAELDVHHTRLRVGVSSGGVVAIGGKPFTPDLHLNVTLDAVRQSVLAAAPPVLHCPSCARQYEASNLTAAEYVELDSGFCPASDCLGRDQCSEELALACH